MGVARPVLAALALLGLAACSARPERDTEEWSHPTKDQLELRTDQDDCDRFFGSNSRERYNCLTAKGWKRRPSRGLF